MQSEHSKSDRRYSVMRAQVDSLYRAAESALRRRHIARHAFGLVLMISAVGHDCDLALADTLRVQGSTTFNARVMEPYKGEVELATGHKLDVVANKSINGLIALIEGRAELAMISAPLEAEVSLLRTVRPDFPFAMLRDFEIARSRVALAVHPTNPLRTMTNAALRQILLGHLTNWRELGGLDLPIRVVAVRDGGGVTATVQAQVLEGRPLAAPGSIRLETPKQVIRVVEQEQGALGLTQAMLLADRKLPELRLDKPIEQHLHIITFGEPPPAARAVIEKLRAVARMNLM